MRTTIDIEDDVLLAAKELARLKNVSAGKIISSLLRSALAGDANSKLAIETKGIGGFRPFLARGTMVGNEQVNALRDQEGI